MDNLTHTFFGWALARAGFDRFGRWATPTMLIAANLPDAEVPLLFSDKASYLTYHRGISHSFCGFVVEATVLSILVCTTIWVWRRRRKRASNAVPAAVPRFFSVLLVALVGLLSHLLLDYFNTYGVRPFLPFDASWFYGDMLFIIDPWTWLILGAALFLGSRRHRSMQMGWLLMAGFATAVVVSACRATIIPWTVLSVWLGIAAVVLALKTWPLRGIEPARAARGGLAVWALYLVLICFASRTATARAKELYAANRPSLEAIRKTSASPNPAIPGRYTVVLQTDSDVFAYSIDVLDGRVEFKDRLARNLAFAASPAVRGTREYRVWEAFARHPCCECSGNIITLLDGRYRAAAGGDWTSFHVRVTEDMNKQMHAASAEGGTVGVPGSFPLMRGSLPE
jgi:inner membrane protein